MKAVDSLIADLQQAGIKLWLKDDKLGCDAPKGVLNEDMRRLISSRKTEIIGFLQQVRKNTARQPASDTVLIPIANRGENISLSFAQQSIWFAAGIEDQLASYNEVSVLDFNGVIDRAILGQCFNRIIDRHEILRTVFRELDGQVHQHVLPYQQVDLMLKDLSDLPSNQQQITLQEVIGTASAISFDLQQGPLLKATLIRLGERHHQLLLVVHHIIVDQWSTVIMQQELAELYRSYHHSEVSKIAVNRIQYADYAAWQRNTLDEIKLEEYSKYWREQLAAAPALLELPTDHPRPAVKTNRGFTHFFQLGNRQAKGLRNLSSQYGVTTYMTLLASFFTLLYRYSGQVDISVGTPVANRENDELTGLVGLFVNTIIIRQNLDGQAGFSKLLQDIRQTTLDAYAHQNMPFEKLVEILEPVRSLSHTPLFQVAFAFQTMPELRIELPGLVIEPFEISNQSAKFDLTLFIQESTNGIKGAFEYSTDLFDGKTIERLTDHFCHLVDDIIFSPEVSLNKLKMLGGDESYVITNEWNATETDLPNQQCLQQLFDIWVDKTPDATAVICNDVNVSYAELADHARRLGARLLSSGAKPNQMVAVVMEKSWQQVAAVYAVLYSGAAYVPIDPNWPFERRANIIEVCDANLVVTSGSLLGSIEWPESIQLFCLEDEATRLIKPIDNIVRQCPQDLAYVIFTSGSTGKPKGVVLNHQGPVNTICDINLRYDVGPVDRVFGLSSLNFDLSVYDIFGILAAGGCLVMPTDEHLLDADHWRACVEKYQVTLWDTVPALMQMLVESAENAGQSASGALRLVMMSGDWIPLELPPRIWEKYPSAKTISLGGATEASIWSISYPIEEINPDWTSIPYGRPMANQHFYVLNDAMEHCPVNVSGSLYIGGIGLAVSYWKDEVKTSESFFDHPQLGRLYRTGDLGRYNADGVIEFLGRVDFQVKVNGYRIELGEIEACLQDIAGVEQAIVEVKEDLNRHKHLVAYYLATQPSIGHSALEDILHEKIPDYMVPRIYVELAELPLNDNGKVNRKALPQPDFSFVQNEYVAPKTGVQKYICEVLSSLMQRDKIGLNDNFFALGGHSLLATQWISRIRQEYQIELSLRSLFLAMNIKAFAAVIEDVINEAKVQQQSQKAINQPPLIARNDKQKANLSFAQQRLWLIDQFQDGSTNYNIPIALKVEGMFKPDVAERVLEQIVTRHEILRTVYQATDEDAIQVVQTSVNCPLTMIDLSHEAASEQAASVQRLISEDAARPFDLTRDLMLRVTWLELIKQPGPGEKPGSVQGILLINMHHIASDGWSMGVLVHEFVALYKAFAAEQPDPLLPLAIQYADYACWQRDYLQGSVLQTQLDYWAKQLADAPAVHSLPLDFARPPEMKYQGDLLTDRLSTELSQQITVLAQQQGVTPFMLLHAAFSLVLARHSNSHDIVLGTPLANRLRPEIEPLIGFFVNTLVLRSNIEGCETFPDYLNHIKQVNLYAQVHQDIPFEYLVDQLQVARSLDHAPLFQIMFSMLTDEQDALALDGLSFNPIDNGPVQAKFDLMLDVMEAESGFQLRWNYDIALFKRSTIERLNCHLIQLLTGIVKEPASTLRELPMLSREENDYLLHTLNDRQVFSEADRLIHEVFMTQARLNPDGIALVFEAQTLTYRELDERSNRLAHYLREQGVTTETLVAIAVERSLEMMVGILAILKAGGAYVPLDPVYPQARLEYIISDSKVELLLTQSQLLSLFTQENLQCVAIDKIIDELDFDIKYAPDRGHQTPDSLAYVIYTSGSTGQPKGVLVEHQNVARLLSSTETNFHFDKNDVWTLFHSFAFDFSVWEMWGALFYGGRLVIVPYWSTRSPADFYQLLQAEKITVLNQTPSAFNQLIEVDNQQQAGLVLRYVIFAGEALNFANLATWVEHRGDQVPTLINMYGITETTVHSTFRQVLKEDIEQRSQLSMVGQPLADSTIYILTPDQQLTPIGATGELYVGGPGVTRGYLSQAELTEQRYIESPFAVGERLYRSGDLARFCANGDMEYLGRCDNQVKIRGFRIELSEISAVLLDYEGIKEALVLARDIPQRLVAYIVADDEATGNSLPSDTLRNYLKVQLPDHMVPAAIVILDAMPLTANGKTDRKALPEPDISAQFVNQYVAPETDTERQLTDLWCELLQIPGEKLSTRVSFFELGGHSLLLVRLIAGIQNLNSIKLSMRQVFKHSTIQSMAEAIDRSKAREQLAASIKTLDQEEIEKVEI